jgi:NDP-sugar pyrophosphorylase family protein
VTTGGLAGVVLAAGAGTRLRPLTELLPKALCPVGNVPLLDSAMARVQPYVERLAVNAHHRAEQIVEHVGFRAHLSVEQPQALGTAGALGLLRPWIDGSPVLATNADAYLAGPLDELVDGWDGERVRVLVHAAPGRGDFGDDRYSGACLLPWRVVAALEPEPTGLYEVVWRAMWQAGTLDVVRSEAVFIDCGTPADYLRANLHASGGSSVIAPGAAVEGEVTRCVVWAGSHVAAGERLVECIRAGDLTVSAPLS